MTSLFTPSPGPQRNLSTHSCCILAAITGSAALTSSPGRLHCVLASSLLWRRPTATSLPELRDPSYRDASFVVLFLLHTRMQRGFGDPTPWPPAVHDWGMGNPSATFQADSTCSLGHLIFLLERILLIDSLLWVCILPSLISLLTHPFPTEALRLGVRRTFSFFPRINTVYKKTYKMNIKFTYRLKGNFEQNLL